MEYNPAHGEPSPFEPVSRHVHPDIIRPIVPEEINPFRNSPADMALLDAIRPGEYLEVAARDLAQHGGFKIERELRLQLRLGGARSILVAVDQLPSVVDLPEWTQHDSRNYEYRGVQFRLEPVDEFHTQTLRLHKELSPPSTSPDKTSPQ